MTKEIKTTHTTKTGRFGAIMLASAAVVSSDMAHAAPASPGSTNNFSTISSNIGTSLQDLPGLMSAVAYLIGVILGILGVLKIKDHVENPTQTPLKDGAIRLAVGGALFALPMLFESMTNTVGQGTQQEQVKLKRASFVTE